MNTKNILIGAGVVVVAYLLWKKSKSKSLKSRLYPNECEMRYSGLSQPDVMRSPEYWEKRKEDWMKINCK